MHTASCPRGRRAHGSIGCALPTVARTRAQVRQSPYCREKTINMAIDDAVAIIAALIIVVVIAILITADTTVHNIIIMMR